MLACYLLARSNTTSYSFSLILIFIYGFLLLNISFHVLQELDAYPATHTQVEAAQRSTGCLSPYFTVLSLSSLPIASGLPLHHLHGGLGSVDVRSGLTPRLNTHLSITCVMTLIFGLTRGYFKSPDVAYLDVYFYCVMLALGCR